MPIGRPKLFFDFARTKKLDPRITFSRPCAASYYDRDGMLKYAPIDTPRFDHNPVTGECLGLLVEGSVTNTLAASELYTDTYWAKYYTTIIPNATTAPDGTITACKMVETVDLTHHEIRRGYAVTGSTTYTLSAFIKAAERSVFGMSIDNGSGFVAAASCDLATLNTTTAAVGASGDQFTLSNKQLIDVGNGWYRFSVVIYTGYGINSVALRVGNTYPSIRLGVQAYAGDPTKGIYVWGVQLELGDTLSSYVPSTQSFASRASTATYYGSDGLVKTAAVNEARMQHNPDNLFAPSKLLVEATSTNLQPYSERIDLWMPNEVTVLSNVTLAPDGLTTADKVVETAVDAVHRIYNDTTVATIGNTYTFSFFAKAAERYVCSVGGLGLFTDGELPEFDLVNGVAYNGGTGNAKVSIQFVTNGWYRCAVTYTATGVSPPLIQSHTAVYNAPPPSNAGYSYPGDGVSGLYIWGAQFEIGAYASSYIPTDSTPITRAADVFTSATTTRLADAVSVSGTNFSSVWNANQGTVAATAAFPTTWSNSDIAARRRLVGANDLKVFLLMMDTTGIRSTPWGSNLPVLTATTDDYRGKDGQGFVSSYDGSNLKIVANGETIVKGTGSGTFADTNAFWLGSAGGSSRYLNACIQRFIYYDTALEDADLKALSKLIAN